MNRRNFIKSTFSGIPLLSSKSLFDRIQTNLIDRDRSSVNRRLRAREMGIVIGELEPGPLNAITDVEGVRVGHTTISVGDGKGAVRTGVTVILPNSGRIMEEQLYSAYFSLNGWGEMTGVAPIEETGKLTTPIFLTGTYNVGIGPVEEGSVGGGTGMTSFGFKGGIGTSSRVIALDDKEFVVGVLVMTNTANRDQLRIDGVPVGKEIKGYEYKEGKTKSIILIAATTAPLLPFQLKKIAKRVALGLAQTGAISHTGSGDIILAFSTGNRIPAVPAGFFHKVKSVSDFWISPLYQGTVEATQEAIINALTAAQTVVGKDGNTAYGLPLDQVKRIMKKYYRLKDVYFE